MSIITTITIEAPPSVVRAVFLNFPSYPEWNPFITRIESPIPSPPPGTRIKVLAANISFDPIVMDNKPDRFRWKGKLFAEWLFNGHHYFEFGPFGDMGENGETQSCKLVHGEEFGGILAFLMIFFLSGMTERWFNNMNNAWKERAETTYSEDGRRTIVF
jgi:hypothetical protein